MGLVVGGPCPCPRGLRPGTTPPGPPRPPPKTGRSGVPGPWHPAPPAADSWSSLFLRHCPFWLSACPHADPLMRLGRVPQGLFPEHPRLGGHTHSTCYATTGNFQCTCFCQCLLSAQYIPDAGLWARMQSVFSGRDRHAMCHQHH